MEGAMIDTSTIPAKGTAMRRIVKERSITAPPAVAWSDWASSGGIEAWLHPAGVDVDLRIGGSFEIYFTMDAPEGQRGSEGCVILAYIPDEMIAFTWNAPPHLALRTTNTWVAVTFSPAPHGATMVRLVHTGFLDGDEWDAYRDYFDAAWDSVLDRQQAHHDTRGDGR